MASQRDTGQRAMSQPQPPRVIIEERHAVDVVPPRTIRERLSSIRESLRSTTCTNLGSMEAIERRESAPSLGGQNEKQLNEPTVDDLLEEIQVLANVAYEQSQIIRGRLG